MYMYDDFVNHAQNFVNHLTDMFVHSGSELHSDGGALPGPAILSPTGLYYNQDMCHKNGGWSPDTPLNCPYGVFSGEDKRVAHIAY